MVNILWVSLFAPVDKDYEAGSRTLNYYFKNISKEKDFKIHLISCVKPELKDAAIQENSNVDCDFIVWSSTKKEKIKRFINFESKYNPFNRYFNLVNNYDIYRIKKIVRRLRKENYSPDVIVLEWTQMVFFAPYFRKMFPKSKIISSEVDVTFIGFERKTRYYKGIKKLIWKNKYKREKKKELNALRVSDLILPQNNDNKNALINEGIDSGKIKWLVPFFENYSAVRRKNINHDIVFYGAMARPENHLSAIWFIDNVMPLLHDLDVRFVVVGNRPPAELKERESDRVIVTGFVESVAPYFGQSMCFAAPLVLGAGIKVKVLEALSSGITVLTNDVGIEGIDMVDGVDYYHCVAPEDYASHIRDIFKGIGLLGENAIKKINDLYSFSKCKDNYVNWIKELASEDHL